LQEHVKVAAERTIQNAENSWLTRLRSGAIIWGLAGGLALSFLTLWALRPIADGLRVNGGHDFLLLYAASSATRAHENPYDPLVLLRYARDAGIPVLYLLDAQQRVSQPYVYSPLFAWLVIPFTNFTPSRALLAWRACSVICFFAGSLGMIALWAESMRSQLMASPAKRVLLAAIVAVAPTTALVTFWGNPVAIVYAAMGGWMWALGRNQRSADLAAGALMSAALLKPQLALALAVISVLCLTQGPSASVRRTRVAVSFVGTCVVLLGLDVLTTGPALLVAWPRSVLYLSHLTFEQTDMPSLLGLFRYFLTKLPSHIYSAIMWGTTLAGIGAISVLYWRLRHTWNSLTLLGLLTVVWCFATPYGHANDEVLLVPTGLAIVDAYTRTFATLQARGALTMLLAQRAAVVRTLTQCAIASLALVALWLGGVLLLLPYPHHNVLGYFAPTIVPTLLLVTIAAMPRALSQQHEHTHAFPPTVPDLATI
jgi:hypothetical protein